MEIDAYRKSFDTATSTTTATSATAGAAAASIVTINSNSHTNLNSNSSGLSTGVDTVPIPVPTVTRARARARRLSQEKEKEVVGRADEYQSPGEHLISRNESQYNMMIKKKMKRQSATANRDKKTITQVGVGVGVDSTQPIPSTQAISVSSAAYIYELREDILHPLVDSTNSRLAKVCSGGEKGGIPSWAVQSCEKVRAKKFFSPSQYTVAVHMWTHTFLGWSFFRGWYNSRVYAQVERELVPTNSCPNVFTEDWYQN